MIARGAKTEPTRVILADDHEMVRDGIRGALEPRMEIVAEVANGLDAVAAANVLQPDLILMDLSLPGMTGIDATRRITAQLPDVKIVCVSMYSDTVFVRAALDAGASGYVLKESPIAELIEAIEAVQQGRRYVDPKIAAPPTIEPSADPDDQGMEPQAQLAEWEIEVFCLVAEGYSTTEIAFRLRLSPKTVQTHRRNGMKKLGLEDDAAITRYVVEKGLTGADPPAE